MKPSLQFRLSQHLTLTPQLQQSIRLLQLSTVELNQEIDRLLMENPANPGIRSTLTVHGVKLDGWSWSMPEDDLVLESVSFRALWISTEDAEGAA